MRSGNLRNDGVVGTSYCPPFRRRWVTGSHDITRKSHLSLFRGQLQHFGLAKRRVSRPRKPSRKVKRSSRQKNSAHFIEMNKSFPVQRYGAASRSARWNVCKALTTQGRPWALFNLRKTPTTRLICRVAPDLSLHSPNEGGGDASVLTDEAGATGIVAACSVPPARRSNSLWSLPSSVNTGRAAPPRPPNRLLPPSSSP